MPETNYAAILTASTGVVLESWPDDRLAALNNALTFGAVAVPEANIAFRAGVDAKLLKEDGWPFDRETLLDALSLVINSRLSTGVWGKDAGQ